MLATGGSAAQALDVVKEAGARELTFVSIIAWPEGVATVQERHPDVPVYTAAYDRALSAKIVSGLGDFGNRLYGT